MAGKPAHVKKLDLIEGLTTSTQKNLRKLRDLADDPEELVRISALEALANAPRSPETEEAFKKALFDSNELVRIAAIEGLEEYEDPRFAPHFLRMLNDPEMLVRAEAATALGRAGYRPAVDLLQSRIGKCSDREKASLLTGLFWLGQKDRLEELLDLLASPEYHARCAAANIVVDMATSENQDAILARLKSAQKVEATVAASSSIRNAIKEIESIEFRDS